MIFQGCDCPEGTRSELKQPNGGAESGGRREPKQPVSAVLRGRNRRNVEILVSSQAHGRVQEERHDVSSGLGVRKMIAIDSNGSQRLDN